MAPEARTSPNHPSVTCGDSSPQGEPLTRPIEFILAPEGSIGEGRKSVKKRAALLHVLAFLFLDHSLGVLRGERLAAHNERRQFAAQTRSCGYSPRWGEHCSLPGFAALNRGPLLAIPQSPKPGCCAVAQRSKPHWGFDCFATAQQPGQGDCGVASKGPRLSVAKLGSEQCSPQRGE